MSDEASRILVVEDDAQVARTVRLGLQEGPYLVDVIGNGEEALEAIEQYPYELVILDVRLPGISGLDVLRNMRQDGNQVSVLILTANGQMQDRVVGLDAGADDYLTKPFGLEELAARVRALLRRSRPPTPTILRANDLEVDLLQRQVKRSGQPISLTNREFEVLDFFLRRVNEVVTRAMLTENVWGYNFDPHTNVVDVHVAHLRSKIDEGFPTKLIRTVRGKGYMLEIADGIKQDSLG